MLGNLAGQLAVDAFLIKGAGKVGTILKETKFGVEMLEKAAEALGIKVVKTFFDAAAQANISFESKYSLVRLNCSKL